MCLVGLGPSSAKRPAGVSALLSHRVGLQAQLHAHELFSASGQSKRIILHSYCTTVLLSGISTASLEIKSYSCRKSGEVNPQVCWKMDMAREAKSDASGRFSLAGRKTSSKKA